MVDFGEAATSLMRRVTNEGGGGVLPGVDSPPTLLDVTVTCCPFAEDPTVTAGGGPNGDDVGEGADVSRRTATEGGRCWF